MHWLVVLIDFFYFVPNMFVFVIVVVVVTLTTTTTIVIIVIKRCSSFPSPSSS